MKQSKTARRIGFALASVLLVAVVMLVGCAGQSNSASDSQTANRNYMSQVNQIMDDLSNRLQGFDDAVSRGDTVTMRTQADNAFRTLDQLSSLEVPDELKDVQSDYETGCTSLKDALNAYIALYTEIETATPEHPFDFGTYDARLQAIQDMYNSGIQSLKTGDEAASSL